jgi:hypothetical protein
MNQNGNDIGECCSRNEQDQAGTAQPGSTPVGTFASPVSELDKIVSMIEGRPAERSYTSLPEEPSALSEALQGFTPPPLFGEHTPAVELQREQTGHRLICYLAAQGHSNVEIAQLVGCTPVKVAYTKKQPWAAKLINELQDVYGRKAVYKILSRAAVAAAKTIAETAKIDGTVQASAAVRAKTANDLLDRLFGKADQTVKHVNADPQDLSDAELAQIAKQN